MHKRSKDHNLSESVDILSNTNFSKHSLPANVPAITCHSSGNDKGNSITPGNPTHPYELPPAINPAHLVLDGKTSGMTNPDTQFCKCLRTRHQTNVDHAELICGIDLLKDPDIFLTQSKPQSQSEEPKEEKAIQQSSYYPKYLKMVAENTKKTPQESASVQPATKRATPKKPTSTTPVKQTKPAPPPTKKLSKRKLPQKVRKGKPAFQLVDEEDEAQQESIPQREDDDPDLELAKKLSLETPQEKGEGEGDDADLERAIKLSLDPAFLPQGRAPVGGVTIRDPVSEATPKLHEVVGKGKAVVTEEQVAHSLIDLSKKKRTTDQFILVRRDQTPPDSTTGPSSQPEDDTSEKVIHESSSTSDSERTESDTETAILNDPEKAHEALAGPDPEPMKEDQTGSDSGKLHVSLAGPYPEHMHDEFLATAYLRVFKNQNLKESEGDCQSQKGQGEEKNKIQLTRSGHLIKLILKNLSCKSALFKHMNEDQVCKTEILPTTIYHHALYEALIAAEDARIRKLQTRVQTKRRRSILPFWVSSTSPKDDEQSSKKPRKSDAFASKQHPALTSTGWQITDTRDAGADSSMHISDPESEHSEQSSDDISMQDEGNDSDMEDN
ncbi:hypothetical protein Tco_1506735 [Tanacetum coccineum]